jgi:hypothetical protein
MGYIWKGPGVLAGTGKPVEPGKPIPDGHVTPERIAELGDRVEAVKATPAPAPAPADPGPVEADKPHRGRPRKGK